MRRIVENLRVKLAKTRNGFVAKVAEALKLRQTVDEELMDELEEILIQSDVGFEVSEYIIDELRDKIRIDKITDTNNVMQALKEIVSKILQDEEETSIEAQKNQKSPQVWMIIGVNGVGKTTTIGKLAKRFKQEGKSVMLIAADTFRAAAIEQLEVWSERAGVILLKQQHGSDPSSVIYDGITSAVNRKIDIVLIDTAGRLHNKVNLMNELSKMKRTIQKVIPTAPDETFLVVDASTGQNAISQTKLFNEIAELTGIILTKLDGTAKGGIVISIKHQFSIPVRMIGVGEGIDDLQDFDSEAFAEALFSE
ncbi:MAG: signal recognition particle-docking protein FtsY [Candidatus Cloacimonas sp.]|jgi:fused signal recognition particle receptor|nr:signal recognition particle-docking protein FtsY [Candidatus Cloacimonadota bacterium]